MTPERLAHGYVIILPGIEGFSPFNRWVARGLVDAGLPYGIEIHDWTRGPLNLLRNIRDNRRHAQQAEAVAEKILRYREEHPTQPVGVIGHSAGGAMTLFTLERLPADVRVTAGILLLAAISPGYDYRPALARTTRGLWNVSSWGDIFALGLATTLLRTCDGRHTPSAGLCGFRPSRASDDGDGPRLTELRYQFRMLADWNYGGHFGAVSRRFVRHWIAPLLREDGP